MSESFKESAKIAFKPIPRQRPTCTGSDITAFIKMLIKGDLIRGPFIEEFEGLFAQAYGSKYAISASSCRSIFSCMVDALGIQAGDEVIIPAFNLPAFPKILKFKGIKPVFVDIDADTLTIDTRQIEDSITPKTKAIVAVHLFGNVCDMERIVSIARRHGLWIIEDCANSYMTKYKGRCVGTYGDVSCFSLGHSKDVPAFGGGMAITNNDKIYGEMRKIHNNEYTSPGKWDVAKDVFKTLIFKLLTSRIVFAVCIFPFLWLSNVLGRDVIGFFIEEKDRMIPAIPKKTLSNFHAFVGIQRLKDAPILQDKRIRHAQAIRAALTDNGPLRATAVTEGGSHAYWNFPVIAENRSEVLKRLLKHGIDGKKVDTYDCPEFAIFKEFRKECPVANRVSEHLLALPIYSSLKAKDVDYMCKILAKVANN